MKHFALVSVLFVLVLIISCVPDTSNYYDVDVTVESPQDNEPVGDDDVTPSDDDDSALDECTEFEVVSSSELEFYCSGDLEHAKSLHDGMLVQWDDGAFTMEYILGNERRMFVTRSHFESWYGTDPCVSCAGVVEVPFEVLNELPVGDTITMRPGSLVLIESDTSVFVVDSCATVRRILPSVAQEIYGNDWEQYIVTEQDFLFTDYRVGEDVNEVEDIDLAIMFARTIDQEVLSVGCEVEDPQPEDPEDVWIEILGGEVATELVNDSSLVYSALAGSWIFVAHGDVFDLNRFTISVSGGAVDNITSAGIYYSDFSGVLVDATDGIETVEVSVWHQWVTPEAPQVVYLFVTTAGLAPGECLQAELTTDGPFEAIGVNTLTVITEDDISGRSNGQICFPG